MKRAAIPWTEPPRGTIANTAEPLPVKRGSMSPAARRRTHSDSKSRRCFPRSASKRLPRRSNVDAGSRRRPRDAANLRWSLHGVKRFLLEWCRLNASAVDTRHAGIATIARNDSVSRSDFKRSPRPSPSAVPPRHANGTSEPSSSAQASRVAIGTRRACRRSTTSIAAAASALPPPIPACVGMRFTSVKRAPPGNASRSCTRRAARSTRLSGPTGTRARSTPARPPRIATSSCRTRSVKPRAVRSPCSVSHRDTDWNTVTRS